MGNREHRRANKHEREKVVRTTIKRCNKLFDDSHNDAVYEELEKPVFWGYSREFVLRDDISARNDASKWRAILNLIQNVEYSKRKDFKRKIWPSRRWQEWRHELNFLGSREFSKKVPLRLQRYFQAFYYEGRQYYRFMYPWMMVSKRRKSYNTHRKMVDTILEQELSYLDDRIEQNLYRQAFSRQKHGYYHWKNWNWPEPREKFRKKFHEDEIREALLWKSMASGEWPMANDPLGGINENTIPNHLSTTNHAKTTI